LNKRGSGIRRLVLMSFFRAVAEGIDSAENPKSIIYAVEEPETSQHPSYQAKVAESLISLSQRVNRQVIITTHIPGLAALLPTNSLRLVDKPDGTPDISGGPAILDKVVTTLGVFPEPVKRPRVLFYVEGESDRVFMVTISRILRQEHPTLLDLDTADDVAFVITGGGNLVHWVRNRYLKSLCSRELHVYDRDDLNPPKYFAQVETVKGEGNSAFLTNKRELENYIHSDIIELCYRPDFILNLTGIHDQTDIGGHIARQVHDNSGSETAYDDLTKEKRDRKISQAKSRITKPEILEQLSYQHLVDIGARDEILGWFIELHRLASSAPDVRIDGISAAVAAEGVPLTENKPAAADVTAT